MVKFIIGAAGSGKTERILGLMREKYESTDRKMILLVPEQQTVVYETLLAERFPPEAALRVEAMSFTRLSNAVARKTGGLSGASVTAGAKALITWRAVASVWDSLRLISSDARGTRGQLVPRISAAREEMRSNAVTADLVEKALASARENGSENDPAFTKLSDLFLVSSAYDSLVREELGGTYSENSLTETVARGAESGFFDSTDVFIDSFFSVTKEEFGVIAELIRVTDVTVAVAIGDEKEPLRHEIPAKRFFDLVASFAYRYTDYEVERLGASRRASTRELLAVSAKLFDYGETVPAEDGDLPADPDSVRVFSVRDRYEEAEAAASVIESIVRRGARYSDIAVIAGDLSALSGVVENSFARHSIPCFRADPETLESSPLARHFLSLLRIPGAWRREDVIRLVKTGLTALTDEEACSFELYTGVWNIRGRRMFSSPWSMNPSGYSVTLHSEDKALLAAANDARDKLIPPVDAFCSVFEGGDADVREICEALMRYAEQSGLYAALTARSRALLAAGDKDGAAREIRTFSKFCECFDEIVRYLPGVRCDAEGFSSILRFAMTDAGTGAIPTGVDEVAIGSAATVRTGAVRHVILLGCVEDEFPASVSDSGFFSDAEKAALGEAGIEIWSDGAERAAMELLRFHRSASLPSESLTLFVPSTSFGEECTPSLGTERVLSIIGQEKPVPFSSLPLEERLFSEGGVDAAIRSALGRGDVSEAEALFSLKPHGSGSLDVPVSSEYAALTEKTAGRFFGGDLVLSQSALDGYVRCPFSYYVRYVLEIGERKKAEITNVSKGNFVHYVLEKFLSGATEETYKLDREATGKICDEIISSYIDEVFRGGEASERIKYNLLELRRRAVLFVEAVKREMAQSRFRIFSVEKFFGYENCPDSMKVDLGDGTTVSFKGKIDRIDTYESGGKTYVRIVDYKTGPRSFDLEKIMTGLDAQLLIYLFSAWRGGIIPSGEVLPAGAMYFSVPDSLKANEYTEEEEGIETILGKVDRSGIFLDDDDVLDAMDKGITGAFLPDVKGKASDSLASLEEFGGICSDLERTVAKIAAQMKSGDFGAKPAVESIKKSPCDWCAGAEICRRAVKSKEW